MFVGLGMLALEFAWAEKLMVRMLNWVHRTSERAKAASPAQKAAMTALSMAMTAIT